MNKNMLLYLTTIYILFIKINSLNNGVGLLPPLGVLTWERFGCQTDCVNYPDACINEELYMTLADAMVKYGYRDAGYEYINIDDCWPEKQRDNVTGRLVANRQRFPSGIKALADYVHKLGLKLGIYSAWSNKTCAGYPGSLGHADLDAQTFAEWGVDSLKLDGCLGVKGLPLYETGYPEMSRALLKTGRQILYACSGPAYERIDKEKNVPWELVMKNCNYWRLYNDVVDSYDSVRNIFNYWGTNKYLVNYAGPGHWNDPDQLIIGDFSLSYNEMELQFGLWAIMAAPLLISSDIRKDGPYRQILLNKEVIAVNQDVMGLQGIRISPDNDQKQVWMRRLSNGDVAVALVYSGAWSTPRITVDFDLLPFANSGPVYVRDLFKKQDLGVFSNSYTAIVPPHSIVMLRLSVQLLE